MAPEQASMRAVDGRTDVFSVGVILWEAIANRRLAEGMSANDVLVRRVEGNDPKIADVVPEVDPELAAICDRAMARLPENRFPSAAELQLALEGWLAKHAQPHRKDWAKTLRDAFAAEREQLRSLVEQRMADSSLSGARPSLRVATTPTAIPSSSRVLLQASDPLGAPPTSRPPHLGSPGSPGSPGSSGSLPQAPHSGSLPHVHPRESSFPARTVSFDPKAQRRGSLPLFAVLGIGISLALGIGATVYVVKSQPHAASDAPSSSSTESNVPPPVETAKGTAPSASASAASTASTTTTTTTTLPVTPSRLSNNRPSSFIAPAGKGPPNVAHPTTASPPTTPTTPVTSPAPTKPGSRPLDEKDPYAP
jgi:serine/threonine-protein kinase